MRAGLGVEGEGAEAAEILYIGEAFGVEIIKRVFGGLCLDGYHDV